VFLVCFYFVHVCIITRIYQFVKPLQTVGLFARFGFLGGDLARIGLARGVDQTSLGVGNSTTGAGRLGFR